jgi:hypothetical protein
MKKIVVAGVIALIAVALLLWALIAGTAFLWKQLPTLTDDGARIAQDALKKGEDVFPGLQEKVKETSPWLAGKVRDILHAGGLPETDIAGEEILPVPRYPGMIRTAYALTDQKKTVSYKGKAAYRAVIEFYHKEMAVLGFQGKVISASQQQETYEYRKGTRKLGFKFEKASTIPSELTALTIREI